MAVGTTFETTVKIILDEFDIVFPPLSSTPLIATYIFWENEKSFRGSIIINVLFGLIVASNDISEPLASFSLRTKSVLTLLLLISESSIFLIASLNVKVILLFKGIPVELSPGLKVTVGGIKSFKLALLLDWIASAALPAKSKIEFPSIGLIEIVSEPFAVPDKFRNMRTVCSPPDNDEALDSLSLSSFLTLLIEALSNVPLFFNNTNEKSDVSIAPLPFELL